MKNYKKTIIYITIVITILSFFMQNITAQTVNVTITPEEPEALSKVTINANITTDNIIQEVYLKIKECKEGFCYFLENESIEENNGLYSIDYQLAEADATYFTYWINVKTDEGWFQTDETDVYYKTTTNNNGNNDNTDPDTKKENNEDKGIPGFEIIIFFVAIFITFMFLYKKDKR